MQKQALQRQYIRLKKRIQRLSFQRLSLEKQARLLRRLRTCEKALFSLATFSALGTASLHAQTYCDLIGNDNPFAGIDVGDSSTPQLVDVNGDGSLDILVGESNGTIFYFQNDGSENFVQQSGSDNPFASIDVGSASTPQLVDLDSDGDLDLISGNFNGTFFYYQNGGSNNFTQLTGTLNPFDGLSVGFRSSPQLVDLDDDGDLDLISGDYYGDFNYFQNNGSNTFSQLTGSANPFDGIGVGPGFFGTRSSPQLVDIDNDNDLDLISGIGGFDVFGGSGGFVYYQNDGSNNFTQATGTSNPFNNLNAGFDPSPQVVDVDGDGLLDLISGELNGTIVYFRNTPASAPARIIGEAFCFNAILSGLDVGNRSKPQFIDVDGDCNLDLISGTTDGTFFYFQNDGSNNFIQQTGTANPFDGLDAGDISTPQLIDIDADGDLDLISGAQNGTFSYFRDDGPFGFIQVIGTANPFDGLGVGDRSTPQLVDFDADGDLDLISGERYGTFLFFQNNGSNNFTELTGTANPLDGLDVGFRSSAQLIDVDGDSDLDLVSGEYYGTFLYYQNDGSNHFIQQTGSDNPLNDLDIGYDSTPQLIDVDGDGDLDLISGEFYGTFLYYQNKPTCVPIGFEQSVFCGDNTFDGLDVGTNSTPQLVDLDADGDLDLVSGERLGTFLYYQNDGSNNFTELTGISNPFNGLDVGAYSTPQLVDLDADGDLDLISGRSYGNLLYYQNDGSNNFTELVGTANPFNGLDIGNRSTPQLIDFDADGDLDLISGNDDGKFLYFQNDGSDNFTKLTGIPNPFDGLDVGSGSAPQLIDLDTDGDLDLVSGEAFGTFLCYQNDGSNNFTQLTGTTNPFDGLNFGGSSAPQIIDLDVDGDLDLISGASYGTFLYFQNKPTCLPATLDSYVDCASDAFDDLDVGSSSAPQLVDLDADGDLDLISGEDYGAFLFFQNDGSSNFTELTGTANPFNGLDVGGYSRPELVDLDADGDLDLVSGNSSGSFLYFQNDGSNNFTELIGTTNPFDGLDVGDRSSPQLIDLDADGDLDLVSGETFGTFLYYQNDGSNNFTELTGTNNPFSGLDVGGLYSTPQLEDVDTDGDLDLVSGNGDGAFLYFQNDGSNNFTKLIGLSNPFAGLNVSSNSTPELIDFDNDGDLDLISGKGDFFTPFDSGTFSFYQNTNLAVSASTVDCASNQAEVELTITSSDTEGPYTLSNAFSGSIGMAGQLGATEVIVTGITESDTYIFEVAVSDGCADLGVAAVVEIDEDCAANGIAVDDTDYIDHGTEEICDASTIRSTAFVGIDVDLTYSASEAIILEPGFEAVNGCAFIARIGGCSAAADNNFVEQRTNEQQHIHINDFVFEETTLHIFPIPTRHFLNYHVEQIKGVQAIYLFDMMGRLVKTDRDLDGTIDISDLPNGQYTLVFEGKGQRAHRLVQKL